LQQQLNAANEKIRMLYKKQIPVQMPIRQAKIRNTKSLIHNKKAKSLSKK
jgi:hypothetical protein